MKNLNLTQSPGIFVILNTGYDIFNPTVLMRSILFSIWNGFNLIGGIWFNNVTMTICSISVICLSSNYKQNEGWRDFTKNNNTLTKIYINTSVSFIYNLILFYFQNEFIHWIIHYNYMFSEWMNELIN